jgi:Flp pilus assembly protein TadB
MSQEAKAGERSAGHIMQDVVRDLGNVVHGEIQLAKAEISEKAADAVKGGTQIGIAAAMGYLGGAAIVTACIAALAIAIPLWAAALIIGVLLCLAASVAYHVGQYRLKQVKPVPERTAQTLRDDLQWVRQRAK